VGVPVSGCGGEFIGNQQVTEGREGDRWKERERERGEERGKESKRKRESESESERERERERETFIDNQIDD